MATLQKFKFLATQCAVMGSPARSPTSSPVIHIRRRKTLRMLLLGKSTSSNNSGAFQRRFLHNYHNNRREVGGDASEVKQSQASGGGVGVRSKLKDLFVSSPPSPTADDLAAEKLLKDVGRSCGESLVRRGGGGGVRPLSATLRQRLLLRRAWRPVLVGIPEVSP